MEKFASMGKTELRAACKAAGIKNYSKMDNAAMRESLTAHHRSASRDTAADEQLKAMCGHVNCPGCGIHLDNGVAHYADIVDSNPKAAATMVREWTCLGCGHEWGEELKHNVSKPTGRGLQIEKNREERNGVKRPSAGGKCRAVWDEMDAYRAKHKKAPAAADVRAIAEKRGWNKNNAMIEFYQWRKFNGITKAASE